MVSNVVGISMQKIIPTSRNSVKLSFIDIDDFQKSSIGGIPAFRRPLTNSFEDRVPPTTSPAFLFLNLQKSSFYFSQFNFGFVFFRNCVAADGHFGYLSLSTNENRKRCRSEFYTVTVCGVVQVKVTVVGVAVVGVAVVGVAVDGVAVDVSVADVTVVDVADVAVFDIADVAVVDVIVPIIYLAVHLDSAIHVTTTPVQASYLERAFRRLRGHRIQLAQRCRRRSIFRSTAQERRDRRRGGDSPFGSGGGGSPLLGET